MAFTFGGSAPAAAPPPPPAGAAPVAGTSALAGGGSFSFGNPPAAAGGAPVVPTAAAFGATTPAAAPAAGGNAFGAVAAPPAPNGTPAPARPATFGTTAAAAPLTTTAAPTGTGAVTLPGTASGPSIQVPPFLQTFPFFEILSKIREVEPKIGNDQFAGQELQALVNQHLTLLSKPTKPSFATKNVNLCTQLQNNPQVKLRIEGMATDTTANLTSQMLEEVFALATDLRISELDALSLYAEVSIQGTRDFLVSCMETSLLKYEEDNDEPKLLPPNLTVPQAAREYYFLQRTSYLQSILLLVQCRLEHKVPLIVATDDLLSSGLISNLITLIRDLTEQLQAIEEELKTPQTPSFSNMTLDGSHRNSQKKKPKKFAAIWRHHLFQERQIATDCLFYLAYSTQLTSPEVGSMIDLLRDLTNGVVGCGLEPLDPFRNVPTAHEPQPVPLQWTASTPFTQPLPPLKERNFFDWQNELVGNLWSAGGKPQLLSCVASLVMATVCSLDTKQELLNRESHALSQVGNDLFPPTNVQQQPALQERLAKADNWKRKDIHSVLAAAYALSLRPLPQVVASPRANGATTVAPTTELKATWSTCLTAPSKHKAFTFLRLTLLPAFRKHKTDLDERCEIYEFQMSVLSDFMASFLDILCASNAVPLSRAFWEDRESERLAVAQENQQRQQEFNASFNLATPTEELQTEVNLLERPDCIDDIIALATTICFRGYAARFGSNPRALKKLEVLQEEDKSLIPTYVSFLAALATAEAASIFDLLNQDGQTMTWKSLFTTLRWYVRRMSDSGGESKASQDSSSDSTAGRGSRAYYYGYDGPDGSSDRRSSSNWSSTGGSKTQTKMKDLSETNTAIMMSHLALVAKVAANCSSGRAKLATMQLSLEDDESSSLDEGDSVLVVLFSLTIAPLVPKVRGAVFATIAALLSVEGATSEEKAILSGMARKAWDLLEVSQAVPIYALDQYESQQQQHRQQQMMVQTMAFPASSLSAANSTSVTAFLPANPKYGMIFELEHVESRDGSYPSTEGLLQLLTCLIAASGCPHDLGQQSEGKMGRLRGGCAPYIEYIVGFVLQRALGKNGVPFKSGLELARLMTRALQAIEAVVTRYSVPVVSSGKVASVADQLKLYQQMKGSATSQLGLPDWVQSVMIVPHDSDIKAYALDLQAQSVVSLGGNVVSGGTVSLPRAKSPGFIVLADLLATTDSAIFQTISSWLAQDGGSDGMHTRCGAKFYRHDVAWSLFADTPPSVSTAKHKDESVVSFPKQSLLSSVVQPQVDVDFDSVQAMDAVGWKARSIVSALRILGAAAVREKQFVTSFNRVTTVVPALQFTDKVSVVKKRQIHLGSVRDLLEGGPRALGFQQVHTLPAIVQYLQPLTSDDGMDNKMASATLALMMYAILESSASSVKSSLTGTSLSGEMRLAQAVATRLSVCAKRVANKDDADVVRALLKFLDSGLSDILLDFPRQSVDGLMVPGYMPRFRMPKHYESLSVLFELMTDDFVTNPSSSSLACRCLEMIHKLVSTVDDTPLSQAKQENMSARFRISDFWGSTAMRFLANREGSFFLNDIVQGDNNVEGIHMILNGAAWFFNAYAMYFATTAHFRTEGAFSPHNQKWLSSLLDSEFHLLVNALGALPVESRDSLTFPKALLPLQQNLRPCMEEICSNDANTPGYLLVNINKWKKVLVDYSNGRVQEGVSWAEDWNAVVRWDHAAAFLASSISSLIESSLEYSDWTLEEGFAGLAADGQHLVEQRRHSLLVLLDKVLNPLVGHRDGAPMSGGVLTLASRHMSTEALLLVDRFLATGSHDHIPHFLGRIELATLSSFASPAKTEATIEAEERSMLLATSASRLLESFHGNLNPESLSRICQIAMHLADLSSRVANGGGGDELERCRAKNAIFSRRLLASILTDIDRLADGPNPIVVSLSESKSVSVATALQNLVQLVSFQDSDVCFLLTTIASTKGGSQLVIDAGIIKACCRLAKHREDSQSRSNAFPPYFHQMMTLLRALLSANDVNETEHCKFCLATRNLLARFADVFDYLSRSFPVQGDVLLMAVETLALARPKKEPGSTSFGITDMAKNKKAATTTTSLMAIQRSVLEVAVKFVEFPFPNRFLPTLPPDLSLPTEVRDWWESIEKELNSPDTESHLPHPPAGFAFWGGNISCNSNYGPWTEQKHGAAFAAAQLVDASLSFVVDRCHDGVDIGIDALTVARSICRLADVARAVAHGLRDIRDFGNGQTMDVGRFDNRTKESIETQKQLLEELQPFVVRSCEKVIVLANLIFQRMNEENLESFRGLPSSPSQEMRKFAKVCGLAIQYSQIEAQESTVSDFAKTLGKHLKDTLKKTVK